MASFYVHEDGSKLQKLTDGQVSNRLAAYNPDGRFERDLKALWAEAGGKLESRIKESGGEEAARQLSDRFTNPVDSDWIQSVAAYGIELHTRKLSVPTVIDKRARLTAELCAVLIEHFAGDERLNGAIDTLCRL